MNQRFYLLNMILLLINFIISLLTTIYVILYNNYPNLWYCKSWHYFILDIIFIFTYMITSFLCFLDKNTIFFNKNKKLNFFGIMFLFLTFSLFVINLVEFIIPSNNCHQLIQLSYFKLNYIFCMAFPIIHFIIFCFYKLFNIKQDRTIDYNII